MRTIACAAAVLMLAACSGPAEAPAGESTEVALPAGSAPPAAELAGFSHPAGVDLFGYYMPASEVQVGNFRLSHLHMGGVQEFSDWEGGERSGTYAPVMLQFEDVTSPMVSNELGGESRSVTERALADAYRITPSGDVAFVDNHPRLGRIEFQGRMDMAALRADQAGGPSGPDARTVLTGRLVIGDKVFDNLAFTWFGGD